MARQTLLLNPHFLGLVPLELCIPPLGARVLNLISTPRKPESQSQPNALPTLPSPHPSPHPSPPSMI